MVKNKSTGRESWDQDRRQQIVQDSLLRATWSSFPRINILSWSVCCGYHISAMGTVQVCLPNSAIPPGFGVLLTSPVSLEYCGVMGHLFSSQPYVPLMSDLSLSDSDQVLIFNPQHCWEWQPAVAMKNNNWQTLWLVLALALTYEIQIPGNQMFLWFWLSAAKKTYYKANCLVTFLGNLKGKWIGCLYLYTYMPRHCIKIRAKIYMSSHKKPKVSHFHCKVVSEASK